MHGGDHGDAGLSEPPCGGESALPYGIGDGQIVDTYHLGLPGQDRVGVELGPVADHLQALERRAHPFPASAVNRRDHHIRAARSPPPCLFEHRGRDAAASRVAQIEPDGTPRPRCRGGSAVLPVPAASVTARWRGQARSDVQVGVGQLVCQLLDQADPPALQRAGGRRRHDQVPRTRLPDGLRDRRGSMPALADDNPGSRVTRSGPDSGSAVIRRAGGLLQREHRAIRAAAPGQPEAALHQRIGQRQARQRPPVRPAAPGARRCWARSASPRRSAARPRAARRGSPSGTSRRAPRAPEQVRVDVAVP